MWKITKGKNAINAIILKVEKFNRSRKEKSQEKHHIKLKREIMDEDSRYYVLKSKLERSNG